MKRSCRAFNVPPFVIERADQALHEWESCFRSGMRDSATMVDGILRRRRDVSEDEFAVETLCRALRVAPSTALRYMRRGFYVAYILKTGN